MNFTLKDKVFAFFGNNEARTDTYKETFLSGEYKDKGIQQRFQEDICANEYDVEFQTLVESLYKRTLSIDNADIELLSYFEAERGIEFMESAPEEIRRKAIKYMTAIVGVKGTKKGFTTFFNLIGIRDFVIDENQNSFSLDSATTFDSPIRKLDSKCSCPTFSISINTSVLDNSTRLLASRLLPSIIDFLSPASAKLDIALYYDLLLVTNKSGIFSLEFVGTGIAVIDWGDETIEEFDTSTGTATHNYNSSESKNILITFSNVDSVSKVSANAQRVSYLFIRDTILNNDTDFEVSAQSNLVNLISINQIIADIFNYSDALQTNSVVIDLRGSQIESVDDDFRFAQNELLNQHDVEIRLGGSFSREFSLDFEQK